MNSTRNRSRSRSSERSSRILSSPSTPTNSGGVTVAIDFGSSVSRVCFLRDNRPIAIPNSMGQLTTPSIVALPNSNSSSSSSSSSSSPPSPSNPSVSLSSSFSPSNPKRWLVGPEVFSLPSSESDRIVLNLKRFLTEGCPRMLPILGGKSNFLSPDQKAKYIQQRYGWSAIWTKNGIQFEHQVDGRKQRFTSAEVLTVFFAYLKSTATSFLSASGITIKHFIVTVPSVFGTLEREWIRDACEEAGLSVLRLLNDSTAAGVAYGVSSGSIKDPTETVVAVLSWGGGVCSCSLINVEGGIIEVMGTGGDAQCGGEDFTQQLIHHCQEEIHRQYFRELTDPSSLRRLHIACDQAKIELSTYTSAVIELADLDGIELFRIVVTRPRFEMLCAQDFTRCLAPIQQALGHAKMTTEQVDQVVLVGGSTRIPKVQQIVSSIFGSKVMHLNLERDDTVAYGAALYSSMTSKPDNNFITDDLLLMDCNPYSLGVNVGTKDALGDEGKVVGMVERNINIPLRKSATFTTSKDNQENIVFRIYEGENQESSKNWFLGEVNLSNLRPGPAGSTRVELSFDIDANEILTVTAEELETGNKATQTHKFSADHVKITEEIDGQKNQMETETGAGSEKERTEREGTENVGVRNV